MTASSNHHALSTLKSILNELFSPRMTIESLISRYIASRKRERIEKLLLLSNNQIDFDRSSLNDIENALRSEGILTDTKRSEAESHAVMFRSF